MATYLSVDWTLARVMQRVRIQTDTISQQKKLLLKNSLIDIVHEAIVDVRRVLDRLVDEEYIVESAALSFTGTSPNYSASLSTLKMTPPGIWKLSPASLFDDTLKKIPILPNDSFDAHRDLFPSTDIGTTAGIATIVTDPSGVPSIRLYSGVTTAPTTTKIKYVRGVRKVVADIDTVDLPDRWVPLAIDVATLKVFRKAKQEVPEDVQARVKADAAGIAAMLGVDVPITTI